MKILNLYYGLEAHNFNAEPYHAAVRYNADEQEIQMYVEKAKNALQNKECFWYFLTVVDVNPLTGAVEHTNVFDAVEEKQKIILNAKAAKTKAAHTPLYGEVHKAMIDDMFTNIAPWPKMPEPAPVAQDTPIPF